MPYRAIRWLALGLVGCASPARSAREQLLAADRSFDSSVARSGVEAWVGFFADSGGQVPSDGPLILGHAAIRGAMTPAFADSTRKLRWEPVSAEVSADGSLGYTIGNWRQVRLEKGTETELSRGRYLTVWRRQADGSWKVEADIGNQHTR
jgi:ketosteroid isomerase-like protein